MPVTRVNANSLVKEFMAFQTLWESQKNDPKSDTVSRAKLIKLLNAAHMVPLHIWCRCTYGAV